MAQYGISTNGDTLYYGLSSSTDVLPDTVKQLTRINAIGGLTVSPENIDASALEDLDTHYIAGRDSVDESVSVTVNLTNDTITEWETLISEFNGRGEKFMWFESVSKDLTKAFWFIGQPPSKIPMPEKGQNELLTVEMNITIEKFHGLDTKVLPTT